MTAQMEGRPPGRPIVSPVTDKLFKFARSTGRNFRYFGEIPPDHWYSGAGIGFAYRDAD